MSASGSLQQLLEQARTLTNAGLEQEDDGLFREAGALFREAAILLREAVESFPEDADARIRLAATIDLPAEAVEQLQVAARLAPDDPLLLTRCASHLYDLEAYDDAEHCARRALDLLPDDIGEFQYLAQLVHISGRLSDRKGDSATAEKALTAAFGSDPEMPGHGAQLAAFLWRQGNVDKALEVIDEARVHLPGDRGLVRLLARIEGDEPFES